MILFDQMNACGGGSGKVAAEGLLVQREAAQLVGREEGRPGPLLRPLKGKTRTAVDANGAKAATFVLTRRSDELRLEFGFAGGGTCTHVDFVPQDLPDVPLSLFARGGRAVFPELSYW